jgi:sugar phosphate isomerase/epimerase
MITFCAEYQIRHLDMRAVNGQNLLSTPTTKVAEIGAALDKAGLRVLTFASPILKWPAPGKVAPTDNADFGFDPTGCPSEDPLEYACHVANILGATRLRFFSYLRHDNFRAREFLNVIERLLDLSSAHVTTMHLKNEPACNIGSISQLASFFQALPDLLAIVTPLVFPIRPLLDIANSYRTGSAPTDDDIAVLAPHVEIIHLKDYRLSDGRAVPLGDGDVPWTKELERLLAGVTVPEVIASIETGWPQDSRNATARSVAAIRRIAADIGVEIR